MYQFRAFRAIDDLESCERYRDGHRQVLIDYGISNITTNTEDWMYNPLMYCIVAEEVSTGDMIGGVRVQVSDENTLLPVENAVGRIDDSIYDYITAFRNDGGVGEICALWNAKKVAGKGISLLLIRSGISIVNQLDINSLVTICADYTMWMVRRVGFLVETSLGNGGEFKYPNNNYIARILHRVDTNVLEHADEWDRNRIFDLRKNPKQNTLETGAKTDVTIHYNLTIPVSCSKS